MPVIFRDGPYRFRFFSSDLLEPPHIHVQRDRSLCKFWLTSGETASGVVLARNRGFADHELNRIERLVVEYRNQLLEAWHDYFDR